MEQYQENYFSSALFWSHFVSFVKVVIYLLEILSEVLIEIFSIEKVYYSWIFTSFFLKFHILTIVLKSWEHGRSNIPIFFFIYIYIIYILCMCPKGLFFFNSALIHASDNNIWHLKHARHEDNKGISITLWRFEYLCKPKKNCLGWHHFFNAFYLAYGLHG